MYVVRIKCRLKYTRSAPGPSPVLVCVLPEAGALKPLSEVVLLLPNSSSAQYGRAVNQRVTTKL